MNAFKHLEWDSLFFGFPIASVMFYKNINIDETLNILYRKGYHLVYFFLPKQGQLLTKTILKKYNGILVDRKSYYRKVVTENLNFTPCMKIEVNKYSRVTNNLIKLALNAGSYSRFKIDPNFGEEYFYMLYTEWIRKSISGQMADYVITYQVKKKPEGLATLKIFKQMVKIGLISVSSNFQNKGIGTCLLNEVVSTCIKLGKNKIEVVTQEDNIKACNFYEKSGFKNYYSEYVYHFWLKNNDSI